MIPSYLFSILFIVLFEVNIQMAPIQWPVYGKPFILYLSLTHVTISVSFLSPLPQNTSVLYKISLGTCSLFQWFLIAKSHGSLKMSNISCIQAFELWWQMHGGQTVHYFQDCVYGGNGASFPVHPEEKSKEQSKGSNRYWCLPVLLGCLA